MRRRSRSNAIARERLLGCGQSTRCSRHRAGLWRRAVRRRRRRVWRPGGRAFRGQSRVTRRGFDRVPKCIACLRILLHRLVYGITGTRTGPARPAALWQSSQLICPSGRGMCERQLNCRRMSLWHCAQVSLIDIFFDGYLSSPTIYSLRRYILAEHPPNLSRNIGYKARPFGETLLAVHYYRWR
jgi:hypothetical protein